MGEQQAIVLFGEGSEITKLTIYLPARGKRVPAVRLKLGMSSVNTWAFGNEMKGSTLRFFFLRSYEIKKEKVVPATLYRCY